MKRRGYSTTRYYSIRRSSMTRTRVTFPSARLLHRFIRVRRGGQILNSRTPLYYRPLSSRTAKKTVSPPVYVSSLSPVCTLPFKYVAKYSRLVLVGNTNACCCGLVGLASFDCGCGWRRTPTKITPNGNLNLRTTGTTSVIMEEGHSSSKHPRRQFQFNKSSS